MGHIFPNFQRLTYSPRASFGSFGAGRRVTTRVPLWPVARTFCFPNLVSVALERLISAGRQRGRQPVVMGGGDGSLTRRRHLCRRDWSASLDSSNYPDWSSSSSSSRRAVALKLPLLLLVLIVPKESAAIVFGHRISSVGTIRQTSQERKK